MAFARAARKALQQSLRLQETSLWSLPELQVLAKGPGSHIIAGCWEGSKDVHTRCQRSFASAASDETHDDFRPQVKAGPAPSAHDQIKQDIADNKIFIYMKGDPSAPQCGFSNMACRILDAYGVDYDSRNVLADPDVREGVKQFTEWPTIPQVFVNGEFVGGSDILLSMHQSGDLFTMLESSGANPRQPRISSG